MIEAMFYERKDELKVRCNLCRFNCLIADTERGICQARENIGGTLYSLVYGKICAESVDPIEKKPLFHVMPASLSYSIATAGCNFHCLNCQNHSISQILEKAIICGAERSSSEIVKKAVENNCRSISYTYTEPTIFFEFAIETAQLAKGAGLCNIFVTNGYIEKKPLVAIAPFLDAANIDLKGFSKSFYRDCIKGELPEVLNSIIEYRKQGIWIELTTLVIPGMNDSDQELTEIANFIVQYLGVDVPWHLTGFYPTYQLTNCPPTPLSTLQRAKEIGNRAGLNYVYIGNISSVGENTSCPSCSTLLIERSRFNVSKNSLVNGKCPACGFAIAGVKI